MGSIKLATTGKKPTKTVDTLVPDINKLLVGLANNKKLKISDKQLDGFLKNIKDAIVDWSNPVKQNKSSLRMSIIGRPARQLWYDKHRPERQYTPDPSTQLKFLYGHILEHLILFLTELAGHTVTDQQKKVNVHGIVGHMDSKIDGEVVDVKTASPYAFEQTPERCYEPVFHEKSGNKKLPAGCVFCSHKVECHKDANEGKGLRAFKYANGKVYLTHIEKEPKVEEVEVNE
jgi:hypothetical protein